MNKWVVVIFPQFEQSYLIEQLRQQFDPLASKVKAHITLLSPFESALDKTQLRSLLEQSLQHTQPFNIKLQGITGHENEYLFLNVKRGNDELIQMRDSCYNGPLEFCLRPQYTYIPHLTLGRLVDEEDFLEALERVRGMRSAFETQVTEISAYKIHDNGERTVEFSVSLCNPYKGW